MGEDGLELFQRLDLQTHQGVGHREIIGGVREADLHPLAFIVPDPLHKLFGLKGDLI